MSKLVLFFLLILIACSQQVSAMRIEQLVMPGKLIKDHAEYEDRCEDCHENFTKEAQSKLCRNCHEEIDSDVIRKKGYHGDKLVKDRKCSECHTDHKGRDAIIVVFDTATFNHKQTDFELRGSHKTAQCDGCHDREKAKYREAKQECYACHKEDEPHKGLLGKQCDDCHNEEQWIELDYEFDHNQTDFPLRYKHEDVLCESCHTAGISKVLSIQCVTCHVINDVHGGRYGKRCQDCHTARGWDKGFFDHDQTKFPLRGSHEKVVCDACHKDPIFDEEMKMDCYSCHKKDDQHRGQNGKRCDDCHTPTEWKKFIFDHDTTDFPLKGAHKDNECTSCHKGDIYKEELKTTCIGCHTQDDVHKEDQGKECNDCHDEEGWNKKIVFDHDMTNFPLVGLHATAPCEECHLSQVYTDAKLTCKTCHEFDDVHKNKLGEKCIACHNPNNWGIWKFDHNTQTEYVLDGKHEDLDCHACHTESVEGEIRLLTTCVSCHKKDDVHDGSLTAYCERCHVTSDFKDIHVAR
jgi:hypothetical protein